MEQKYGLYTCGQYTWPIHRHFGFNLATKKRHIVQYQQHYRTLCKLDSSLSNADRYAVQTILHMARRFYQEETAVGLLRRNPSSLNGGTQFSDAMVNFWQLVEGGGGVFNRHTGTTVAQDTGATDWSSNTRQRLYPHHRTGPSQLETTGGNLTVHVMHSQKTGNKIDQFCKSKFH